MYLGVLGCKDKGRSLEGILKALPVESFRDWLWWKRRLPGQAAPALACVRFILTSGLSLGVRRGELLGSHTDQLRDCHQRSHLWGLREAALLCILSWVLLGESCWEWAGSSGGSVCLKRRATLAGRT